MTKSPVFLDANALIYALDQTGDQYDEVVTIIQMLLQKNITLCTSHHVIEEVIYVAHKISGVAAVDVMKEIHKIPGLVLVEPDASIDFAERYAVLCDTHNMGVNDALLLQLMIDAGIERLLSYDKQLVSRAALLNIRQVA